MSSTSKQNSHYSIIFLSISILTKWWLYFSIISPTHDDLNRRTLKMEKKYHNVNITKVMNTADSITRCASNMVEIILLIHFSSNRFEFMTSYYYGKLSISLTLIKSKQMFFFSNYYELLSLKLYSSKLSFHSNFTKWRKDKYTHFNLYNHIDRFFIQKSR